MCDNEIHGQEEWMLVTLGGVLILARPEIVEMAEHVWNDTESEWRDYVRGLPK